VKSIGNITIDYWDTDLDDGRQGKIKSIKGNSSTVYAIKD
jgi:hypothetical protein